MTTPFIRPYDATRDFENGLHVFYTTIQPDLDYEPARCIGSYLWFRAYVHLSPQTCFVLDDGHGTVVGYCIGAADTASFAAQWRDEFTPTVDAQIVPAPSIDTGNENMEREDVKGFRKAVYQAECSMLLTWREDPNLLKEYPAHLHIDILPEFQRKGFGAQLIGRFCEEVKGRGAGGVHLDMVRSNTAARAFYESEKVGFGACTVVLDGGESGEVGVQGVVVTLVKRL